VSGMLWISTRNAKPIAILIRWMQQVITIQAMNSQIRVTMTPNQKCVIIGMRHSPVEGRWGS
jgi:hypothetical protein